MGGGGGSGARERLKTRDVLEEGLGSGGGSGADSSLGGEGRPPRTPGRLLQVLLVLVVEVLVHGPPDGHRVPEDEAEDDGTLGSSAEHLSFT